MSVPKEPYNTDYSVSELTLTSQESALRYLIMKEEYKNLKKLIMTECHLPAIPKLPDGLEYLDISRNLFNYLPPLPSTLTYLNIVYNEEIIENLVLPPNLEILLINSVDFLNVKLNLPKTLKSLYIDGTDDYFELSKDYLPDGLLELETYQTGDLHVYSLPDSITKLLLDGVSFDKQCSLPKSLVDFGVWYCIYDTIPPIPDSVDTYSYGFDFEYGGSESMDDITECYQYLIPIKDNFTPRQLTRFIYHNWNITKHRHSVFLEEFMKARVHILMTPTRIARLIECGELKMDDPNMESILLGT